MDQANWQEDSKFDISVQGEERSTDRAVLATIFFPGLGHFYCGKISRAFALFLIPYTIIFLATILWANSSEQLDFNFLFLLFVVGSCYLFWLTYDAYRLARDISGEYVPTKWNNKLYYTLFAAMIFVLSFSADLVLCKFYFRPFRLPAVGMSPTLLQGDHILANYATYRHRAPKVGDVAILHFPQEADKYFIRRVVGVPGDKILISNSGDLYRNGQRENKKLAGDPYQMWLPDGSREMVKQYRTSLGDLDYRILVGKVDSHKTIKGEVTVKDGHYFVLSDFRSRSYDSREVGLIPRAKFLALAGSIYFSSGVRDGIRWERIGERVQ